MDNSQLHAKQFQLPWVVSETAHPVELKPETHCHPRLALVIQELPLPTMGQIRNKNYLCHDMQPKTSSARLGSARIGSARLGSDRFGSVRLGSVRLGSARFGSVRLLCLTVLQTFGYQSQPVPSTHWYLIMTTRWECLMGSQGAIGNTTFKNRNKEALCIP